MPLTAPSVIDQISASLSISSLQNQVIASNIANRDTPGYQRKSLRFEHAMNTADGGISATSRAPEATASIEQDLVSLSSNLLHYQAMTRMLSRYFSIVSAITGQGRG